MTIARQTSLAAAGILFLLSAPGAGLAQQTTVEGAYRGSIVCEHLSGTAGILRAPLDIVVSGTTAIAARPVFNRDGSRVVGSEIMTGTVNADGALHLMSSWTSAGASFKGTYNGTLTATGGTISGAQAWTRAQNSDGNVSRPCYGAYVRSASPHRPSRE